MPAYVMFSIEVTDPEQYERYKTLATESISAAGGRYVVRGGEVTVLEGDPPVRRTVVVEFPSRQAALDWYHGDGYAEARKVRQAAAQAWGLVVDGVT